MASTAKPVGKRSDSKSMTKVLDAQTLADLILSVISKEADNGSSTEGRVDAKLSKKKPSISKEMEKKKSVTTSRTEEAKRIPVGTPDPRITPSAKVVGGLLIQSGATILGNNNRPPIEFSKEFIVRFHRRYPRGVTPTVTHLMLANEDPQAQSGQAVFSATAVKVRRSYFVVRITVHNEPEEDEDPFSFMFAPSIMWTATAPVKKCECKRRPSCSVCS